MKNNAVSKIRLLKDIQPNPDWLKSQRSNLLFEISESGKQARLPARQAKLAWKLPVFVLPNFAFKPVMVSLTLFCLIFGGGFLGVLASKDSLPGDLLYPLKIAVENTRIKVSSQETKSKLQAEFVGNRVEELTQIIEETEDPIEKKEKVVKAVNKLQAQIVNTKVHLDKIKEAETVEAISEKTAQSEKALIEVREKIVEEFKEEESREVVGVIDEALAAFLAAREERERWIQMEVRLQKEAPIEVLPTVINEASVSFEEIYDDE